MSMAFMLPLSHESYSRLLRSIAKIALDSVNPALAGNATRAGLKAFGKPIWDTIQSWWESIFGSSSSVSAATGDVVVPPSLPPSPPDDPLSLSAFGAPLNVSSTTPTSWYVTWFSSTSFTLSIPFRIMAWILTSALDVAMVLSPVAAYVPQYLEMRKTRHVGAFSPFVSLVLIIASIGRSFFWLEKRFETPLLLQALLMIVAQLVLTQLVVRVSAEERKVSSLDHSGSKGLHRRIELSNIASKVWWSKENFWNWSDYPSYVTFVVLFSTLLLLLGTIFSGSVVYGELLGAFSLGTEAFLGMPQVLRNARTRSTAGLSRVLIGSWFLGDGFKTLYFFGNGAPTQFIACGFFQLAVDCLILYQMFIYGNGQRKPTAM